MCRKAREEQSQTYQGEGDRLQIKLDIIKDSSRGYIVRRLGGSYEQHAHISTMNGCRTLINLIHNNKLPTSAYLQTSCHRLLTDVEYSQLKAKKQQYYNINKGVRKRG